MSRKRLKMISSAVVGSMALVCGSSAWATSGTYIDAASGGTWTTTTNWLNSTVATGQDGLATFGTPTVANTVTLSAAQTIGSINFSNTSTTLGWTIASSTLTLSTSVNQPSIYVTGAADSITSAISGTQGFVLSGTGQLTYAPAATLTGTINISSGTLVSSGATFATSLIGSGTFTNNAVTTFNTGNLTGFSGAWNAPAQCSLNSPLSGGVFLGTSATAAYSDTTAGTNGLILTPNGAAGVFVSAIANMGSLAGTGEVRGGNTAGADGLITVVEGALNTSTGFSGVLANNTGTLNASNVSNSSIWIVLALTKVGTGVFTLSGVGSAYGGPTNIAGGTLAVASLGTEGTSGLVASSIGESNNSAGNLIFSGGALAYTGATGSTDRNFTIGAGVTATFNVSTSTAILTSSGDSPTTTGAFNKSGAGSLVFTAAQNYSGGTNVVAGTLEAAIPSALPGYATAGAPINISSGATLAVAVGGTGQWTSANIDTLRSDVTFGTGTALGIDTTGATSGFTYASNISGAVGVTKIGTNSLTLTGSNTYTGTTTINAGTLIMAGYNPTTGPLILHNGGILQLVANSNNTTGSTSTAIGAPSSFQFSDGNNGSATVQLRSDTSVTFANTTTASYTGSTTLNLDVNNVAGVASSGPQGNTLGFGSLGTYQTTINVTGGNGYTLALAGISNANAAFLTFNASSANLTVGNIPNLAAATLTVIDASGINTTITGVVDAATGGGITKTGAGSLTLSGANTYTGVTNISGGTLFMTSTGSVANSSNIKVGAGAIFDITGNPSFALGSSQILSGSGSINGNYNHTAGTLAPGGVGTIGTLTFNNNLTLAGGTVAMDLSNTSGGTTNDLITVTGGLTLSGSTMLAISLSSTPATNMVYDLINYNTAVGLVGGASNLVLASPSRTLKLDTTSTPGEILLDYSATSAASLIWTGTANGNWDVGASQNWNNSGTADYFYQNDNVTFDDSSANTSVNLTTTLTPASVLISSNNSNYVFSGSGNISGGTSLNKTGASTLTISNNNTFTGAANIAAGAVAVTGTAGLGTGALNIASGAVVQVGNGSATGTLGNSSITDNGLLNYNLNATVTPIAITGTGMVSATGSGGNVILAATDTYSGGTNISNGTVTVLGNGALGTGPVNMFSNGVLGLGYAPGNFVLADTFNLSGAIIHTGYNSPSSLSGSVYMTAPLTVDMDGGSALLFTGSLNTGGYNITTTGNTASYLTISATNPTLGSTNFIGGGPTFVFAPPSGNTYNISGTVSGSSGLAGNGPGTVILSGSNSYTGTTTVNGGILEAISNSSIGSTTSALVFAGGANVYAELALTGGVAIANPITENGRSGTFGPFIDNVSGNNALTGAISFTTSGAYYALQSDAGLLTVSGAITQVAGTGNRYYYLQGAGNGLITSPLTNGTGVINVIMTGTGTWTLTGNNTYTGVTQVSSGTLAIAPSYSSGMQTVLQPGGLNISGGLVAIAPAAASSSRTLLVAGSLNMSGGNLDLANNDAIIQVGASTSLSTINSLVAAGYNSGAWNGTTGIVSTSAAANARHLTALGVIVNDNGIGGTIKASFDGQTSSDGDVLIKYTYYGDADLSGVVDGSDYTRIDNGYLSQSTASPLTGWYNGDFNYDGVVNGSDYTLIDNAFNTQGATLAAEVAAPTAQITGGTASSAVPEPGSLFLLGMGAIGLLGRRRRC